MHDNTLNNDSSIWNQVWDEICDIKFGERYLAHYLDRQKRYKKIARITILICSGSGIGGYIKDIPSLTIVSLGLIGLIQIFSLIENDLLKSDSEIEAIMELREKYVNYLVKLQELWSLNNTENPNSVIGKKFFKLKKECWIDLEKTDNKVDVRHWKKLKEKAQKDSETFLSNL